MQFHEKKINLFDFTRVFLPGNSFFATHCEIFSLVKKDRKSNFSSQNFHVENNYFLKKFFFFQPFMMNNNINQSTSFKRLMYSVLGEAEL